MCIICILFHLHGFNFKGGGVHNMELLPMSWSSSFIDIDECEFVISECDDVNCHDDGW